MDLWCCCIYRNRLQNNAQFKQNKAEKISFIIQNGNYCCHHFYSSNVNYIFMRFDVSINVKKWDIRSVNRLGYHINNELANDKMGKLDFAIYKLCAHIFDSIALNGQVYPRN